MFAGDAVAGTPDLSDYNVTLDRGAYRTMRPVSLWVPSGEGGLWRAGPYASFTHTTDAALLNGMPVQWWFEKYFPVGHRNLWGGPLLHFAFSDTWHGHSVASGRFVKGKHFDADMLSGERALLATLPGEAVTQQR